MPDLLLQMRIGRVRTGGKSSKSRLDGVKSCRGHGLVILSEAKDHLAPLDPRKKILRFAQDDTSVGRATDS